MAQINASTPGIRVVLGGTDVLNSSGFMSQVDGAVSSWPDVLKSIEKASDGAKSRLAEAVGR